ncbi:hypothetical protein [Hahella ganghwensis]|uniref:hypothetical protein n=1 Tax=Hahella ganghwensis TaxID=286420 RepID=UPI00036EB9EC|nr:hypothetical protein [Hahella ganghwensis]
MKLPVKKISLSEQLAEFDLWITPSLQEIQDTDKYTQELAKVDRLICRLGEATNNFASIESCSPKAIAATCVELVEQVIAEADSEQNKITSAIGILESLCALLFMVTGKTDNNLKCQFPVFLAQTEKRADFPQRKGKNGIFQKAPLGRTIKSDKLAKVIADALVCYSSYEGLEYLEEEALWLLGKYITAILKDEESIRQFWALGKSYFTLMAEDAGSEKALLAPIIIFKVRGSVSASGGHIPEDRLREMMSSWGMERGVDFNLEDVILEYPHNVVGNTSKTRAYDFVLPYRTEGWQPHIFVQCQYYAGDSGSVSHKVIDQTQASRHLTLQQYPNARFLEYLGGAGYYSSLNTDLQHMLGMETTKDFIQVRSAHVKLRREIQDLGFLVPIDIEHAIFRSNSGRKDEVMRVLESEGYSLDEIQRAINHAIQREIINRNDDTLLVSKHRTAFAKRLFIVDLIAIIGEPIDHDEGNTGNVLIPGYGELYGSQLAVVSQKIDEYAPNSNYSRNEFAECITWLIEEKFIILR